MGITKTEVFDERINKLARYAKAAAHPARVAILEYLLKHRACICGDLVEVLPLSQSTISQHLKELKNLGIIQGEIEGPRINYCIDGAAWAEARRMFGELFDAYNMNGECC
jgi:DNA-binding transcriptional ArsR family regulator